MSSYFSVTISIEEVFDDDSILVRSTRTVHTVETYAQAKDLEGFMEGVVQNWNVDLVDEESPIEGTTC